MIQNRELETLQARIREAEERLKAQQLSSAGLRKDVSHGTDSKRDYRTSGEDDNFKHGGSLPAKLRSNSEINAKGSTVSSTSEAMSNGPPPQEARRSDKPREFDA